MKPSNIWLVRHGQSEGNADKNKYAERPDYAIRLTDLGVEQAKDAGAYIKEHCEQRLRFYVSPFWRTRQTYQHMLTHLGSIRDRKVYEDPRLREQEWGKGRVWRAEDYESWKENVEKERDSTGHFYYRFDGGESCADVHLRMSSFLDTFHREFQKEERPWDAVIVFHGMALRVFLMRWFHMSVEQFEAIKNPDNGTVIQLQLNPMTDHHVLMDSLGNHPPYHNYQYNWEIGTR